MGSLKRKEVSAGGGASKTAKTNTHNNGGRPSKRAKADKADDKKRKSDKSEKSENGENKAPASGIPAVSLVSKLKEDEPLFPRGGGSVLTPLEFKQIQVQAKSDALFDQEKDAAEGDKQAKRKPKNRRKGKESAGTVHDATGSGVKIESLNYKVRCCVRLLCEFDPC